MDVASGELSKCTSLADARRWASARGLKLVGCEDVRDSCDIGALSRRTLPHLARTTSHAEVARQLPQFLELRADRLLR